MLQPAFGRRAGRIGDSVSRQIASHLPSQQASAPVIERERPKPETPTRRPAAPATAALPAGEGDKLDALAQRVMPALFERIDTAAAAQLGRDELREQLRPLVAEIAADFKLTLNRAEQNRLEQIFIDEAVGLGPLEPLLVDAEISDILVNGPNQVYVERGGKLVLSQVRFRSEEHVLQVAQRICNRVGRRIDQSTPLADARLEDGSRVNIVAKPLSLNGPTISIRKFAAKPIDLDVMAAAGSCSPQMAAVLKIAARSRLNIVVSGGTGSGKTTMLNALSKMIDHGERIVTIEDAAELQLQQPHVVTLETRPTNVEGNGGISIRDLVVNALRMRPDRIILGEIRGAEAIDLLQAMNTGHEGSLCTLHANSPREALTRIENMTLMGGTPIPRETLARQIAEAIDLVVQVKRLRDGSRRVTSITEVVGIESNVMQTQELFRFEFEDELKDGRIRGSFVSTRLRPYCLEKVRHFCLDQELMEACK